MEYIRLLRRNPDFARLWYAQAISLLGDWFNTIILSALVARYSENAGLAVSILLLTRFLPPLLVSPFAGVLLDRFDRRRLLILSDVARVFVVLGYLFVTSPDHIWLIYVLSALQFAFSALFEPGRSALMPSMVQPEDLVRANLLSSVTWSVMLAVGGALGGFVSAVLGSQIGLVIDAGTFAISALLIASIRVNPVKAALRLAGVQDVVHTAGFVEGLRYARRQPGLIAALLVKAGGSIGNIDVPIVIYGTLLFAIGQDGSASMGLLWSAFGVGAVIGPVLLNLFNDGRVARMRSLIIVGYALITVGWFALAGAPGLVLAMLAILVRAMGGSIYWTYSSVIIQKTVDDSYLGRMFSLDQAGFQFMTVISIVITGVALQIWGDDSVREIVAITGLLSFIPLALWSLTVRWLRHTPEIAEPERA
ncbi:MAG TPA: MFS transporter [Candidatus Limnocylindrales bacterium]|nr:MFS transporter [Candidatus Limnocylindrales bacterium]